MKQLQETLFISHEDFKGYSKRRQLTFLRKMKEHRLMRNQSVEWGYGPNYLSQMYFKLRTEEAERKREIKEAKGRGVLPIEKVTEKKIEKEKVVQIVKKKEDKKEEVHEKIEEVIEESTSKIKIEASSISMELALSMISDLRKQFGKNQSEFILTDNKDGCDLVFTAQELP